MKISAKINHNIQQLVIDRTFIDTDDVRWIIDFKTSVTGEKDLAEFLDTEEKKYQQQLETYAQALSMLDKRQIKMGLYFPLIPAWREVTNVTTTETIP